MSPRRLTRLIGLAVAPALLAAAAGASAASAPAVGARIVVSGGDSGVATLGGFALAGGGIVWGSWEDARSQLLVATQDPEGPANVLGTVAVPSIAEGDAGVPELLGSTELAGATIDSTICVAGDRYGCDEQRVESVGRTWVLPGVQVAPTCQQQGSPCANCLTTAPWAISGTVVATADDICDLSTGQVVPVGAELLDSLAVNGDLSAVESTSAGEEQVVVMNWSTGQTLYSFSEPLEEDGAIFTYGAEAPIPASMALEADGTLELVQDGVLDIASPSSPTPQPYFTPAAGTQLGQFVATGGVTAIGLEPQPAGGFTPTVAEYGPAGSPQTAPIAAPLGWSFDGQTLATATEPCGAVLVALSSAASPTVSRTPHGACGLTRFGPGFAQRAASIAITSECPASAPSGCAADVRVIARVQRGIRPARWEQLLASVVGGGPGTHATLDAPVNGHVCGLVRVVAQALPSASSPALARTPESTTRLSAVAGRIDPECRRSTT